MDSRAQAIRTCALEAGFDFAGIAVARPASGAERLGTWLASGMHGTMRYMEDPEGRRADPRRYVPWARSLVLVGLSYWSGDEVTKDPARGAISCYAWGRDYHREVRSRLEGMRAALAVRFPGCRTHPFVDTSPVLEKALAADAGLGWRGKHTNLLRKRAGSWFFLGGLATDLDLEPDQPARDHCGTCRRCIDICPTRAIVAPYVLDARLCISYLTIEHRGAIPLELRSGIGNRVFGCDDCQEVCPWNRFAVRTPVEAFRPREESLNPSLPALFALTRSEWNRRFKKTPVRRAGYEGFLRNVAVALGNWGAPEAVPALVARLADPAALVRGHVAWALGRIGSPTGRAALAARREQETDARVLQEIDQALAEPAVPEPTRSGPMTKGHAAAGRPTRAGRAVG